MHVPLAVYLGRLMQLPKDDDVQSTIELHKTLSVSTYATTYGFFRAANVWLALSNLFSEESQYITRPSTHGAFHSVAQDTTEELKEQLNGIAFINQCHIMHSVHRLEISFTRHKQKVHESFRYPLATCSFL